MVVLDAGAQLSLCDLGSLPGYKWIHAGSSVSFFRKRSCEPEKLEPAKTGRKKSIRADQYVYHAVPYSRIQTFFFPRQEKRLNQGNVRQRSQMLCIFEYSDL